MVRKKLAAAIAAIGALQASVVSALGMGDFSLNSALNQPLDAEIRLTNIADLDATQVLVKMASPADFSNAGVSRDFFLTNIRFNVEVDGKGNGIVRVTTRQPVIEPYLNFLVEAHWPSGRMLREYTVLLDLPVFSESAAKPVAQPVASSRPTAKAPVSTPARQAPVARQAPARRDDGANKLQAGEQYRVKNDDTLWEIALNSRPGADISVQQAMLGIQRLNPNAFIQGNINRLKAGSVLRLPTRDQISISDRQAIGEVASHNRAWRQGDDSVTPTADVQLDATDNTAAQQSAPADGARLSIATSAEGDSSGYSEGEKLSGSAGGKALQDALAAAEENLDKTAMENQELQSRLSDMESKLATLQRLIELKDDQLAALQMESATGTGSMQPTGDATSPATAAGSGAALQPKAEQQPKPVPARPVTKPAEKSLLDQLTSNPLYAGGAGLLILAIAAIVLMRRRKSEEAEDEQDYVFDQPDIEPAGDITELSSAAVAPTEDESDQDADTDLLVAELESEIAADNAEEQAMMDEVAATASPVTASTALESETGDVIAEADIYVAYGRYQQAIDLLRTGAEQEPQRSDLQLKLLEVYIETRDKPAFQQQFKVLQGLGKPAAIASVKEMLSSVDGVSDWLDGIADDTSQFNDADMDADLIEGEDELAAAGDTLQPDDIDLTLDEELDLDLDEVDEVGLEEANEVDLDLDLDTDTDLELDLDTDSDLDLELDLDTDSDSDLELDLDLEQAPATDDVELDLDDDLTLDLSELDDVPETTGEEAVFDLDDELLDDELLKGIDDVSEAGTEDADKTVQYHVSDFQDQLETDAGDIADSLELDDELLDESLQLDEDLSAETLDEDVTAETEDVLTGEDTKPAEGTLPVEDTSPAEGSLPADGSPTNDEFDLDLDEELDLESLADTDLGDLEAEFGDADTKDSDAEVTAKFTSEDLAEIGEDFDLDSKDTDAEVTAKFTSEDLAEIGEDFDLDTRDTDAEVTAKFTSEELAEIGEDIDPDTISDPAAGEDSSTVDELDLDLDSTSEAAEKSTVEYTLDDVAAELAAKDTAADTSEQPQAFDSLADADVEDDDFDFLSDTDEVATKLDLARAYIDMGDSEGARDILDEVLAEGNEQQIQEANALVKKID